jgi:hypothetical protein
MRLSAPVVIRKTMGPGGAQGRFPCDEKMSVVIL